MVMVLIIFFQKGDLAQEAFRAADEIEEEKSKKHHHQDLKGRKKLIKRGTLLILFIW